MMEVEKREWFQKKRYRIPLGLFALMFLVRLCNPPSAEQIEQSRIYKEQLEARKKQKAIEDSIYRLSPQYQIDLAEEKEIIKNKEIENKIKKYWGFMDNVERFIELEYMLEKNSNDPESFEHIKTVHTFIPSESCIMVKIRFRGKNAFGGLILSEKTYKLYSNGLIR